LGTRLAWVLESAAFPAAMGARALMR
jgi:hypothetical protein